MDMTRRQFASDNYAGMCPEVLDALIRANSGHCIPYGEDEYTARACNMLREFFAADCEVFFVFNGTAANSLALASLCQSYHSIICHQYAHIETDECGAPEFFSNGTKILIAGGINGKLSPREVEEVAGKRTDIHYPKPRVISITQATEVGTVYSVEEVRELGALAKRLDLRFHMDGARLANALAALDVAPEELTWKAGLDVLCLGGVKNGISAGEAVVFFNRQLAHEFDYRCKQAGQLASKMRFLSAPWIGLLSNDTWKKNALHANRCARVLHEGLSAVEGIRVMFPVEANSVFVEMTHAMISGLHDMGWRFYTFIGEGGVRLMCSWDTTDQDVEYFIGDVKKLSKMPGKDDMR
ncbi:MAG TPA: low specificity L-threonine aldolase [Deltaproteobacteria bacterium]|nr:low specificity L-threonine aldolase [Deltaproteobacteria bacterium]HXK47804.1 low specificity L-threonine aldolase [Deltaproteobacteria bacterium]